MSEKVAFVTGASRGIGKAIAVELAGAGYDVAITARTVHEGDAHEHSSTVRRSDTSPLPGSLDSTADLVRAEGQRCLTVAADLLDHPTLVAAADRVLGEWGHVDVLVNNGRYVGPGHMDLILDTPVRVLRDHLEANALAPVVLVKAIVPGMIDRGGGTVINITSGAGYGDPPAPAGQGGWGLGYAFSKGAMHRIAGVLAVETAWARHPRLQRAARLHRDGAHRAGHGGLRFRRVDGRTRGRGRQGLLLVARVARRRAVQRRLRASTGAV